MSPSLKDVLAASTTITNLTLVFVTNPYLEIEIKENKRKDDKESFHNKKNLQKIKLNDKSQNEKHSLVVLQPLVYI